MPQPSFTVAAGVGAALAHTGDTRAYYIFSGDLGQMGLIYEALLQAGFEVVKRNVYPGFPEDQVDEFRRALDFVFERRIEGWWNQREALLKYEICTENEYEAALR